MADFTLKRWRVARAALERGEQAPMPAEGGIHDLPDLQLPHSLMYPELHDSRPMPDEGGRGARG